jgi:hypothetical protein
MGNTSSFDSILDGFFSVGKKENNNSNCSWIIFIIIFFLIIGKESCFNFLKECCGEVDQHHHHHEDECGSFGFNGNLLWIIGILIVLWLLSGNFGGGICKGSAKEFQTIDECC